MGRVGERRGTGRAVFSEPRGRDWRGLAVEGPGRKVRAMGERVGTYGNLLWTVLKGENNKGRDAVDWSWVLGEAWVKEVFYKAMLQTCSWGGFVGDLGPVSFIPWVVLSAKKEVCLFYAYQIKH